MGICQLISDYIDYFNHELTDPRVEDKFLMSSPFPTLGLVGIYFALVKFILPLHMKNKPAYDLKNAIFYYNVFQVILSSIIAYKSYGSGFVRRFSLFKCRELDQSTTDPDALMALSACHLYFLSKFTEFLDTIFFVLRKKNNQVTFLHLYHHMTMPVNAWLGTKIAPGGSIVLAPGLNGSIHVVMYTYYLLSGLGPRWQKYLWWKKYLTSLQLVQFALGLLYSGIVILGSKECPILNKRSIFAPYAFTYLSSLVYLFYQYYYNTYIQKKAPCDEKQVNGKTKILAGNNKDNHYE